MTEIAAYVLYDDETITALICAACLTSEDDGVPIFEAGTIECSRCGRVA